MHPAARRSPSASAQQERPSSGRRASIRSSVVGLPQGSRPSTRSHSAAEQNSVVAGNGISFGWGDPNLLTDLDMNPNNYSEYFMDNAEYGGFGQPFGFETTFEFPTAPDATRASVNLLQNPFSALPGTPQTRSFNAASAGIFPSTPGQFFNFSLMQGNLMQPNGVGHALDAREGSHASPKAEIHTPLFVDGFVGYTGDDQDIAYPSPTHGNQGALSGPYYGDATLQPQNAELSSLRSPRSPRSTRQLRSKDQSRRNSSYQSVSSYPDRSGQSSAGDHLRGANAYDLNKRRSVVDQRNFYQYAQPRIDVEKPWIRINRTTRGETTRSAKCNDYDPSMYYKLLPHPIGDWSSGRYDFKYTNFGEWKEWKMPAAAIRDFILRYPEDADNGKKLKLFIQVSPTDSARRYLSPTWTKCRFSECPTYKTNQGTILHGHYRVAFDERSWGATRDEPYDPHLAAGAYVHLYCFERFLDMEYMCRKAHIHVDDRNFPREPRGRFAATLAGHPEYEIAQQFLEEARNPQGNVRSIQGFENYPRHKDYKGQPKPHQQTLVYRMHEAKKNARPPAQMKQFMARGLGPTHLIVNYGDLEIYMQAKLTARGAKSKARALAQAQKRKAQQLVISDDSSSGEDIFYHKKTKYPKPPPKKKPGRPPKHHVEEAWDGTDSGTDDELVGDAQPSASGTRRSKRAAAKVRKDYRELEDPPLDPNQIAILQGYVPAAAYEPPPPSPRAPSVRSASVGPFVDPELEGLDFEAYFGDDALARRTSSMTPRRRSTIIVHKTPTPSRTGSSHSKRHASFSRQPVSHSQEFDTEAPPRDVEASPRRRTRSATPYSPSATPKRQRSVQSGRVAKRRKTG